MKNDIIQENIVKTIEIIEKEVLEIEKKFEKIIPGKLKPITEAADRHANYLMDRIDNLIDDLFVTRLKTVNLNVIENGKNILS